MDVVYTDRALGSLFFQIWDFDIGIHGHISSGLREVYFVPIFDSVFRNNAHAIISIWV